VRRIEAVTGPGAYAALDAINARLRQAADLLRTQPEHMARRIEQLLSERDKLETRVQDMLKAGAGAAPGGQELAVGNVMVTIGETAAENRDELGQLADQFRSGRSSAALVLFGSSGRGALHVAITDDLVKRGLKAGDLVNRIAAVSGGKGGGRPTFASGSAGDPALLPAAREAAPRLIEEWLASA